MIWQITVVTETEKEKKNNKTIENKEDSVTFVSVCDEPCCSAACLRLSRLVWAGGEGRDSVTSQLSSRSQLKPAKLSVTFSVHWGEANKVTEALIAAQRQTLSGAVVAEGSSQVRVCEAMNVEQHKKWAQTHNRLRDSLWLC